VTEQFTVIGAGTMGVGIAYVAAVAGYAVSLVEVDPASAARAGAELDRLWRRAVARDRMSTADAGAAQGRLSIVDSLDAVPGGAEVCVEAVPERPDLKQSVLAAAEATQPVLLATNTSSIALADLAADLARPEDFCGLHFFNPVPRMELLEIVRGPKTSEETLDRALVAAARLGKQPVVVRDAPGFASSRLGVTLGLEAIRMLAEGVAAAEDIDRAITLGYRHPVGPLELTDIVGLDVRLDIARTLQAAYGDRFAPPQLLIDKVARGELGRKAGHGFYRWEDGRRL
jgi:3-hydroxybutyryl-CoA dehydrogenase